MSFLKIWLCFDLYVWEQNCKHNNLYTAISLVKLFIDSLSLFNVTKVVNSPRKCVTQLGFPDHTFCHLNNF